MAALSKHTNVKIFSEKLLLLLNRAGESLEVCMDVTPMPCDSVTSPALTSLILRDGSGTPTRTPLTPVTLPSR